MPVSFLIFSFFFKVTTRKFRMIYVACVCVAHIIVFLNTTGLDHHPPPSPEKSYTFEFGPPSSTWALYSSRISFSFFQQAEICCEVPASAPMSLAPSSTRTSSLSLAKILQTLAASPFSSSVPENTHPGSTVLHFLSTQTWGLSSQHGGTKSTADSLQSNGAQCTLEMVLQTALLYFSSKFTPPFSMIIMSSFPQSLQTSKFPLIPSR